MDEAIGSGNLGLVKAALRLDPTRAAPNATTHSEFISKTITGHILHDMRDRYGRSANGGVERNKPGVMAGTANSLDKPIGEDDIGEVTLKDILSVGDGGAEDYEFVQLKNTIMDVVRTFDIRSQEIFIRRHQLEQTQAEIGQAVGCSQMQVSRLLRELHSAIREELAA